MEGRIAIRSDAVILKNNQVLLENGSLIGNWIREGEDAEEVCRKKAKSQSLDITIVKPLHPLIQWGMDDKGEKAVVVSLNYLAELKGEENGG
ncbi:hypothetical protein A3K73_00205 [Candidatus Pacearchaeota archaeon RBG_13_36_9]|nr:MAG: hypothetical protein A3K73_00205 [Candidatus Pacearchaeota archaeon RBG_13_36_9]